MNVMKPIASSFIPTGNEWLFEVKYDGFRCILDWDVNHIKLTSKNNKDLTKQFPEIVHFCLENQDLVIQHLPLRVDSELVILNTAYQANFPEIQRRGRLKNIDKIKHAAKARPATLMTFDILMVNNKMLEKKGFKERKQRLKEMIHLLEKDRCTIDTLKTGKSEMENGDMIYNPLQTEKESRIQLVDAFDKSDELWKLVFDYKAEGLIAKRKKSSYQIDKSHHDWFKIKNWRQIHGILHSYNVTNGYFLVSVFENDELRSIGKCKHGLDDEVLHMLKQVFLTNGNKQGKEYVLPPAIVASIHTLDLYDGELREPEFAHLDVNMQAEECTFEKLKQDLAMFPPEVELTNIDKVFWPVKRMTKGNLLTYIREIAPYILPFMKRRALTLIRCPDGVDEEHFFQKHLPDYAPDFVDYFKTKEDEKTIICNNLESLVWFANHGAIEYHLPFQTVSEAMPIEIVFDLDPPSREKFKYAIDAALLIKKILDDLKLISFIKTSGNKGLQIHIPIPKNSLSYEETALFTQVVAWTVERMNPEKLTTERFKNKRGGRLYIDYVQHGKDKTLIAPYSPRKTSDATVATPLDWEEVTSELRPEPFTMEYVLERVHKYGCPFMGYFNIGEKQQLDKVKKLING